MLAARVITKGTVYYAHREYEMESNRMEHVQPFSRWLRERCAGMVVRDGTATNDVASLSREPSRRVCSFRSMTSYGSHYRVEGEDVGGHHVTYDCGVAELQNRREGEQCSGQAGVVHIIRVGTLKDILVLNYENMNIVLMVVSWVESDTTMEQRLRRDPHGFWLANMDARPRCSRNPYILPSLASQVRNELMCFPA